MGSKGATTTATSAPPQAVQDMYAYLTQQGKALQQQPYQQYQGTLVPDINQIQQAGLGQAQQYSQSAQPAVQQAMTNTQNVAGGYNPQQYAQGVAGYMNPYVNQAMGATAAQLQNINAQQQQSLLGNQISQGAFGGDRAGIASANLANQQNLAMGQTLSQMANQGYQNAAQNYMAGLGAQGQLANQLGALGISGQQAGLAGAQAVQQAGAVPYAVQQAQNAAQYQQFAQGQAYPFQSLGFLANIASGLGAGQGGTSTSTQPYGNALSSALGLGTALLQASDERAKENIEPVGKTFDGQNIYKFNYKGDPKTNVGLMAQEVEHHHPDAVHTRQDGMKMVDYNKATEGAADRGHFADGGSSQGGLVPPSMARQPYATYGHVGESQSQYGMMPYADDPLTQEMATLSKIVLGSYVPHLSVYSGGMGLPTAPRYQEQPFDTSGITGFGKSLYNKFGPSTVPDAKSADMLAAYQDVASQYPSWTPSQSTFSASGGFKEGGLVRSHHADGDTPPKANAVPADDYLGSIGKSIGGLFSTKDQPGLIGNLFNKGQPLSDDARLALMAAGFATAASPSPFVLQAIGQGGLAGVNTLANMRKAEYENAKNMAELGIRSGELGVRQQELPMEQQKIDISRNATNIDKFNLIKNMYRRSAKTVTDPVTHEEKNVLGWNTPTGEFITEDQYNNDLASIMSSLGLSPAIIGAARQQQYSGGKSVGLNTVPASDDSSVDKPTVSASDDSSVDKPIVMAQAAPAKVPGAIATDASQTGAPEPYYDIDPKHTPAFFSRKAQLENERGQMMESFDPEGAKAAYESAKQFSEQAKDISLGSRPTLLKDGTMGYPQSIVDMNRKKAAADKVAQDQAEQASKFTTEGASFLKELPSVQQTQDGLINAYQKIDMNRTADFKANLIGIVRSTPGLERLLNAGGIDINSDGFQGLADTAAKDAIVNAFRNIAANASGKTTNMQLKESLMSVAEPVKDPAAKYQVITQERANQLRNEAMTRDWMKSKDKVPYADFVADWTDAEAHPNHSQKYFDQQAVNQIDYFAGMTPKDIENLPYKRTSGSQTIENAPKGTMSRQPWMTGAGWGYDPSKGQYVDSSGNYYDKSGNKVPKP